jgi:hypothetical protein
MGERSAHGIHEVKTESATSAFNRNQRSLQSLFKGGRFDAILRLILEQNAIVHCSRVSGDPSKTHEDELWAAGDLDRLREFSSKGLYSGAWHLWHSARIEDICSHYLIGGTEQLYTRKLFREKMDLAFATTGNEFDEARKDARRIVQDIGEDFRHRRHAADQASHGAPEPSAPQGRPKAIAGARGGSHG